MSITVPPAVNYQSPLIAVPCRTLNVPKEGNKMISCEVDWSTMGGSENAVSFNLQNNATLEFSQVIALQVDNSLCGSDIQFIFPDTSTTTTIPAFSPYSIVEVFTNQTMFYLYAAGAEAEDISRFSILNFLPPPISISVTPEQNAVVVSGIAGQTVGDTALVGPTISGTVETIQVFGSILGESSTKQVAWNIQDGNGKVIAGCSNNANGDETNYNSIITDLQDIRIRFQDGLTFNILASNIAAGSIFSVNLFYRTP